MRIGHDAPECAVTMSEIRNNKVDRVSGSDGAPDIVSVNIRSQPALSSASVCRAVSSLARKTHLS